MKIGNKLFSAFGVTVLGSLVLGWAGLMNVGDLRTQQMELDRQNVAAMDSLLSVSQDALKLQLTIRSMILTPSLDQRQAMKEGLASLDQRIGVTWGSFQTDMVGALSGSDAQILTAFRSAYDNYQVVLRRMVDLAMASKTAEALDTLDGDGAEQARAMDSALAGLSALNTRLAQAHYAVAMATADRAATTTWGLLIVSTLFSVGAALFLTRSLADPLVATAALASRLAQGDLQVSSAASTARRRDEMGDLARSVDALAASLTSFVTALRETDAELGAAASSLNDRASSAAEAGVRIAAAAEAGHALGQQQTARIGGTTQAVGRIVNQVETFDRLIEDQVASVTQTTASIEEMSSNIRALSARAAGLGRAFGQLRGTSDEGRDRLFAIVDKIAVMADQSGRLSEANDTIKDIAGQTNILSMNAAIEAAHAGSAGAGFAVVADEIRKLAEQTAVHSVAINREVEAIRSLIDQTAAESDAAKNAFGEVLERIDELGRFEAELTSALAEQGLGAGQILEATTCMSEVSAAVRAGSTQILEGSRDIEKDVESVEALGERMQITLDGILADSRSVQSASDGVAADAAKNRQASARLEEVASVFHG